MTAEQLSAEADDLKKQSIALNKQITESLANVDSLAMEPTKTFTKAREELADLKFRKEAIDRRIASLLSEVELRTMEEEDARLKQLQEARVRLISTRNDKLHAELIPLFLQFAVLRSTLIGSKLTVYDTAYLKDQCRLYNEHPGQFFNDFNKMLAEIDLKATIAGQLAAVEEEIYRIERKRNT